MKDKKTLNIVLTGLFAAIIYILTYINIPFPLSLNDGGLIHLGGAALLVAAYILMPPQAALAGAIGMGLFDLLSPYTVWAPFTFVIRLVQGYVVAKILLKSGVKNVVFAAIAFTLIGMVGYYAAEAIIYSNIVAPMASIPGELFDSAVAIIVGIPIASILKKNHIYYKEANQIK